MAFSSASSILSTSCSSGFIVTGSRITRSPHLAGKFSGPPFLFLLQREPRPSKLPCTDISADNVFDTRDRTNKRRPRRAERPRPPFVPRGHFTGQSSAGTPGHTYPETARVVSFRVRQDVLLKSIIQFVDATQGFDGSDFRGKLIQPDVYSSDVDKMMAALKPLVKDVHVFSARQLFERPIVD